ncbi:cation diffusion facilitator family transporter [Halobacillus hunanensis]|uniref:cation diffusion facilitator family transporter n=1 Tax=Halobacillus hunanensis TaxID=578214 RepID=UPI0009A6CF1B|nr:cation diffusion facilitator family transporter [Halobacillus hunanensis]
MSGNHGHTANKKALLTTFILISGFMIAEFLGGLFTNSLALLSDSGHMLSDSFSLGLSLLAFRMADKQATDEKTYGFKRFEVLAALFNGITLFAISIYIFIEAYQRFLEPPSVASYGMLGIAFLGLVINIIVAWILRSKGDTKENLNMRSAFLHVLGDLLGSVGAIVAALLILFFNWNLADPIVSVVVSILIIISAWRVTKDSIHVLMEGTPETITMKEVTTTLLSIPNVEDIHDLHVWTITSGYPALSGHLEVKTNSDRDKILLQATQMLKEEFGIEHSTLQLEDVNSPVKDQENHWDWERR